MTPEDVKKYFSKDGKTRGAQARFAKACNITPQYASSIMKSGEIPFAFQCELQVRSDGLLKVSEDLLGPAICDGCGREIHDEPRCR